MMLCGYCALPSGPIICGDLWAQSSDTHLLSGCNSPTPTSMVQQKVNASQKNQIQPLGQQY